MKMYNRIVAPVSGVITELDVTEGDKIAKDHLMVKNTAEVKFGYFIIRAKRLLPVVFIHWCNLLFDTFYIQFKFLA